MIRSTKKLNIFQEIREETRAYRDNIAIIEGNQRITYHELLTAVDDTCADLVQAGVTPGKRVAFLCNDCTDYIIISLAVLALGSVIVPISPSLSGNELDEVVEKIDVHFLVFDSSVHADETATSLNRSVYNNLQFGIVAR